MRIVPSIDRVVVKFEKKQQTESGILLPESAQKKSIIGIVVASGVENIVSGDRVLVSRYAGSEVEVGDQAYTIFSADDILGTVHDDE